MTDVLLGLRVQAQSLQAVTNATITWVPTAPVPLTSGMLLPAPKAVAIGPTGNTVIEGVEPCDGLSGWCWSVTSTEDGVVRDQRYVLVPDVALPAQADFNALVQVRLSDLRSLNTEGLWVGLEDNPPPAWFRGWWLVSAPGNPALGIETGSGDLRRVL